MKFGAASLRGPSLARTAVVWFAASSLGWAASQEVPPKFDPDLSPATGSSAAETASEDQGLPTPAQVASPAEWAAWERRNAFEVAWASATEAARARVRQEAAKRRRLGRSALEFESPGMWVRWSRMLQGLPVEPTPGALEDWMASWNLQIQPGFGELEPSGTDAGYRQVPFFDREEVLLVQVSVPGQPPAELDIDSPVVQLDWVGPQGMRLKARAEKVHRSNFDERGFSFFLTRPAEKPGLWRLEPSLWLDEHRLYGFGARFALLAKATDGPTLVAGDPGPASDSLGEPAQDPGAQAAGSEDRSAGDPRVQAHRSLHELGMRDPRLGEGADLFERDLRSFWPQQVLHSDGTSSAQCEPRAIPAKLGTAAPKQPSDRSYRWLVWIVAPGPLPVEAEFGGPRGAAWQRLAGPGVHVHAHSAPLFAPGGVTTWSRLAEVRATLPGARVLLLVAGPQVRDLRIAREAGLVPDLDGLVVLQARKWQAPAFSPIPSVPTLFLWASDEGPAPEVDPLQKVELSMDPFSVCSARRGAWVAQHLGWFDALASGSQDE